MLDATAENVYNIGVRSDKMLNENIRKLRKSKGFSQEELDTTVNNILGETVAEEESELKVIAAKLELLNEQFAKQSEAHRRTKRIVSVIFCILSSVVLFCEFFSWLALYIIDRTPDTSIAIIGGSDGPTQILVAEPTINPFVVIAAVIVIILSVTCIIRTKKGD